MKLVVEPALSKLLKACNSTVLLTCVAVAIDLGLRGIVPIVDVAGLIGFSKGSESFT